MINYRNSTGADLSTIAWVSTAIGQTKAAAVASLITVHSYQFSADIVAVSGNGRAFRRYRAIVDATTSPPPVLYWKDLTYLGWPLDPTILTTLRSGTGTAGAASSTGGPVMKVGNRKVLGVAFEERYAVVSEVRLARGVRHVERTGEFLFPDEPGGRTRSASARRSASSCASSISALTAPWPACRRSGSWRAR